MNVASDKSGVAETQLLRKENRRFVGDLDNLL